MMFVLAALAASPKWLFDCRPCEANRPLSSSPGLGDFISKRDDALLASGETCVPNLADLTESATWAAWSGQRSTGGTVRADAATVIPALPAAGLDLGRDVTVDYALVDPRHDQLELAVALLDLNEPCLQVLFDQACAGNLEQVEVVTDVFQGSGLVITSSSELDVTVDAQGTVEGVTVAGGGSLVVEGDRTLRYADPDGLVVGFRTAPLQLAPGVAQAMEERCP